MHDRVADRSRLARRADRRRRRTPRRRPERRRGARAAGRSGARRLRDDARAAARQAARAGRRARSPRSCAEPRRESDVGRGAPRSRAPGSSTCALSPAWYADALVRSGARADGYGARYRRARRSACNVEYVSANPTGDAHGRARAATPPTATRVARLFEFAGPRGHARVLLQRLRAQIELLRPVAARTRARRGGARGRLSRARRSRELAHASSRCSPDAPPRGVRARRRSET